MITAGLKAPAASQPAPAPAARTHPAPPLPRQVRVGDDGPELLVCALREGGAEMAALDLLFDA